MSLEPNSTSVLPTPADASPSIKVLVADDGKNAADIMGMFLKMEGYDVRVVYDGDEAIRAAGEYRPNVILMDISMPGTDGIEAARRILASGDQSSPVIVALSGYDMAETKQQCEEAGIRRLVAKPVSPADLRTLLNEIVASF